MQVNRLHPHGSDLEASGGPSYAPSAGDDLASQSSHIEMLHDSDHEEDDQPFTHTQSPTLTQPSPTPAPRRSTRNTRPPIHLADYITRNVTSQYPITFHTTYDNLSKTHKHFAMTMTNITEPTTFDEAVKEECWRNAMKAELQALEDNQTWDIVPCPAGKKPIGCKWVYKIKLHSDGRIERYKARLVAKGFTQIYDIDFLDTFSPVVKMNTVKLFLAVAAVKQWHLEQMDISNAFLHGDLDEEVYMELPQGIHTEGSDQRQVCRLRKSLYGLKQASRQWFAKLTEALLKFGFIQSMSDHSLFTKETTHGVVHMLVYVDDLII
ncbi:Retrovirus-related Pol polyprotein from transposon RE1 [Linum perenne]